MAAELVTVSTLPILLAPHPTHSIMRDLFDSLMLMHLCACRFCISPNGDMAGNNPNTCYWGLPSIAAMDQWDRKRHICENFSVSTTKCALVCCIYLRSEPAIESV